MRYSEKMIKRTKKLIEFERRWLLEDRSSVTERLRALDALYSQAKSFGVLPPANPLEGIDADIRLARVLNSVRRTD